MVTLLKDSVSKSRKPLAMLRSRLYRLKKRASDKGWFKSAVPVSFPFERGAPDASSVVEAKKNYQHSNITQKDETFVLYRIIGNDLVPRHAKGQSRQNLAFILDHEPELPGCEKRFVVNRLVDSEEERAIIGMLEAAGMPYLHIPFSWEDYRATSWDVGGVPSEYAPYSRGYSRLSDSEKRRVVMRLFRFKNNYVMNNNGARNAALQDGKKLAKWVLPWDGNCFVTSAAWQDIVRDVTARPECPYFIVPMARMTDNDALLAEEERPVAIEEPQLIFRSDSQEGFDPECYYGRRPKVELFWRLGIPGVWDKWAIEPWDLPCPEYSQEAGVYAKAGWVARLFSGQAHLENTPKGVVDRGVARNDAIAGLLEHLDEQAFQAHYQASNTCFIGSPSTMQRSFSNDQALYSTLREAAETALGRGPYSVVDKKTLPPSNNSHDYWHPAPYYWPNPIPIPGLPYWPRDGKRVPGTRLYEPMSDNYDRMRLQRLFDDTFVLALAGSATANGRFDVHAAQLIRRWFLDPESAMSPHLEYAQVRQGWNRNRGSSSGLIEAKDFYYFLDAVRLLEQRGALSASESAAFREWLAQYLHWLRTSPQGVRERASLNNHGTYYDLQVGAIAAFLGEGKLLRHTLLDSRCRIVQQFAADGAQPEELKRTTTAHYCCFNLQGWIHLAQLAESCGEDLWGFEGPQGQSLRKAMEWLLPFMGKAWPYQQIDDFDTERFYPLYHAYREHYGIPPGLEHIEVPAKAAIKPLFFPHDGIRPFWQRY
ncbi:alginate lyase family protein [Halomonas daqiaonensis]|uniref:Alginate lyase n=1 Tax=Halomonas daqiaonensis TaxID=650850 RepID=A0A1H7VR60_9GAMM|nr:alginate lyase family protein [Halomonas daqiaonensis]SEM11544.1 Alginate lyase [Halomonas daqiaonensis]